MKKYYSLTTEGREASVMIYGEITSWPWMESDVSSYNLSQEIERLDVDVLHVYINSPGGEVGEGVAIYTALKRHKAKIITYADGFACSIAATIFAAGNERVMYDTSLLMIHNAWTYAAGDADGLRKAADDLETINSSAVSALQAITNVEPEKLKEMLDAETWINAADALEMGFATRIDKLVTTGASASGRQAIYNRVMGKQIVQTIKIDGLEEIKAALEEIKTMATPDEPKPAENKNFWNAFSGRNG